ncbi:MAG TPA: TlpA disulfide reductase family protein [Pyrinomonadaceae bacterium]|jgi:peroxiredoxin
MRKIFVVLFAFSAIFIFTFSIFGQKKTDEKQLAPTFSSVTLDNKAFNTADFKGKIVVLNLWFISCPNCIEEIKLLNNVVDEYKNNKDVVFLGLATDKKPDLEKFLKKNPFSYQIVPNASQIMLFKFGERQKNGEYFLPFPTHVVIDREGRLVLKVEGVKGVEAVKNELKKQLETKQTKTK